MKEKRDGDESFEKKKIGKQVDIIGRRGGDESRS